MSFTNNIHIDCETGHANVTCRIRFRINLYGKNKNNIIDPNVLGLTILGRDHAYVPEFMFI